MTQLERAGAQTLAAWLERMLAPDVKVETVFLYDKSGSDVFDSDRALLGSRPRGVRDLARLLRGLRNRMATVDVVVAHTHYAIAVTELIGMTLPRRPRIIAVHHWPLDRYPRPSRWALSLGAAFGLPDGEVFVSDAIKSGPTSVVIPNPVPSRRASREGTDGLPAIDLLVVARHSDEKGIDVLIRAMADLPGRELTLVGGGPQTPELERLAKQLGLSERVHFLGYLENARVRGAMERAQVVVLPSRWEAMPMVLLEAISVDVPLVVSDIPAHDFVTEPVAALSFRSGDAADLAEAIRRLPTRLDELRAGREWVRVNQSEGRIRQMWISALEQF